jgi:16S rRNA G1207 methylase RsmC
VLFAAIWSNPPIRVGKAALHEMLRRWLPRLTEDGCAYLVVHRNLGADSLHAWLKGGVLPVDADVTRWSTSGGYRVLRWTR